MVDDEELERKVVAFTLQNSGLPIQIIGEAGNGREALEQVSQTWPHLIIMDIKMPGIDGLEATRQIKALSSETEIIMLTAYGKFSYSQQAIKAQADDYLLKPIKPQQLVKAVAEAISRINLKRLRSGPAVDLSKISEQVRLGNLEEAKREWTILLESVTRDEWEKAILKEELTETESIKHHTLEALAYSFGRRVLVVLGQAALSLGANTAEVTALEQEMGQELVRISSLANFEQWGGRLLEMCLKLRKPVSYTQDQIVVRQAVEYIEMHFAEDISLVDVSEHIHLSSTYLSRIFNKKMGMGFSDFVTHVRLKAAKKRLLSSTETIEQIAAALGFSSSSYFSSVFKKHEGVTPSEYRAKHSI